MTAAADPAAAGKGGEGASGGANGTDWEDAAIPMTTSWMDDIWACIKCICCCSTSVTDGASTGSTGETTGPSLGPSTVLARLLGGPTGVARYRAGAWATRLRYGGILKQRANENRTGSV